jgi:hypothetical protein
VASVGFQNELTAGQGSLRSAFGLSGELLSIKKENNKYKQMFSFAENPSYALPIIRATRMPVRQRFQIPRPLAGLWRRASSRGAAFSKPVMQEADVETGETKSTLTH